MSTKLTDFTPDTYELSLPDEHETRVESKDLKSVLQQSYVSSPINTPSGRLSAKTLLTTEIDGQQEFLNYIF